MLVGLTGGIGSGKSLAAKELESLGAYLIDADELAREAVQPGTPELRQIVEHFGDAVLDRDGRLNRRALAERVFGDREQRRVLESIVHPRVRRLFEERVKTRQSGGGMLVYVVPLLFEAGYGPQDFDRIVVVSAPREICLQRVMRRDGCSRREAEQRYDSQMPLQEKERRADVVWHNTGSEDQLRRQIAEWYKSLA